MTLVILVVTIDCLIHALLHNAGFVILK